MATYASRDINKDQEAVEKLSTEGNSLEILPNNRIDVGANGCLPELQSKNRQFFAKSDKTKQQFRSNDN